MNSWEKLHIFPFHCIRSVWKQTEVWQFPPGKFLFFVFSHDACLDQFENIFGWLKKQKKCINYILQTRQANDELFLPSASILNYGAELEFGLKGVFKTTIPIPRPTRTPKGHPPSREQFSLKIDVRDQTIWNCILEL